MQTINIACHDFHGEWNYICRVTTTALTQLFLQWIAYLADLARVRQTFEMIQKDHRLVDPT